MKYSSKTKLNDMLEDGHELNILDLGIRFGWLSVGKLIILIRQESFYYEGGGEGWG